MMVYANIKRPVFKGFNTIWSLQLEVWWNLIYGIHQKRTESFLQGDVVDKKRQFL